MADYSVTVKDLGGGTLASDIGVEELTLGENLNAAGTCSITVPLQASYATQSVMAPGQTYIEVSRSASLKWAGYIWSCVADISGQTLNVSSEGWYSRFRRRSIQDTVSYASQEQLDIAWDIIHQAQLVTYGDMGITRWGGESASGINRKKLYCCYERTTLADAIEELASADDGFDFEITPAKVWKAYYPRKGTTSATAFTTGSGPTTTSNVTSLTITQDATDLTTEAAVVPDTDYCNDIELVTSSNIATYNLLQETIYGDNRANSASDLRGEGREHIRLWRVPRYTAELETALMPWTNYDVGDLVTLTSNVGYATLSALSMRVMSWTVNVKDGIETAQVELDSIVGGTV